MLSVLRNAWALLLGMLLLMIGNGLQGTLLGIRGSLEGFNPAIMSYIMSAYMFGMLVGSRVSPFLIAMVGHVRVFAALASLISAAFIGFAIIVDPLAWFILRVIVGLCFAGVYVASESWLNEAATNANRGKTMSIYMIIQMIGILIAQFIINLGDPSSFILFGVISVLVSVSFAPILLSVSRVPVFNTSKMMSVSQLYKTSPLCSVTMVLVGGVSSLLFGMSAVYGIERGFSVKEISFLVGSIYIAGALFQYPVGLISDRTDRRMLIVFLAIIGFFAAIIALFFAESFYFSLFFFFIVGGIANPLYSVVIAYTNDYLDIDDMAAAAGGLVFLGGLGGVFMPVIAGQFMNTYGPEAFIIVLILIFSVIVAYGLYRTTKRAIPDIDLSTSHVVIMPQATNVAVELSQEATLETNNNSN